MPFTPFHMGAALIVKPGLGRNFSLIAFGLAQIAMDIEPGVGMLTGAEVLHGPTHTILGAVAIAFVLMQVAPRICSYLLGKWNKEVILLKLPWLLQVESPSRTAIAVGAFFGTLSHVALDSLMHHDIHPLSPFSQANPLMGMVSHDGVYQLCAIAGAVGTAAWAAMHWTPRSTTIESDQVQPVPAAPSTPSGMWKLWVRDLGTTWFWLVLFSVLPSLLFSTALFSMVVFAFAVMIATPATAISRFFSKNSGSRGWRQLAVMVIVPVLSLVYILKSDDKITKNAEPIVNAIETYRSEAGKYPDSLDALAPRWVFRTTVTGHSGGS